MMRKIKRGSLVVFFVLGLTLAGFSQTMSKNSISVSTAEGIYSIFIPNEVIIETSFIAKDSAQLKPQALDSLLINMGNSTEITLSTIPISDTLNISMEGIVLQVMKNPFSIIYRFQKPWYNLVNGKKFQSGNTFTVVNKNSLIPKLVRGGALIPAVKVERDELWQVHYFFEGQKIEKKRKLCSQDFNAPAGEECIEVEYKISGKELVFNVNSTSPTPTIDEMELVLHGLENRIEFVWLNNIKYTPKNFLHEGKQFIPLRFDSPQNVLRIELK